MNNQQQNSAANVYDSRLYIITAKTNMHVGSGETSLGLVDNRVQRDVLTGLPNINASGLKGALREYFSYHWGEKDARITNIFGSDSSASRGEPPENMEHKAGKFRFFNANLLSIPVRSNLRPYFHAASPEVLGELLDTIETFGYQANPKLIAGLSELSAGIQKWVKESGKEPGQQPKRIPVWVSEKYSKELMLEDFEIDVRSIPQDLESKCAPVLELTGDPLVLMAHQDFKEICSDDYLPLIARNNLENGRSKNLWHEQVVPRESRFYFFLLKPGGNGKDKLDLEFKEKIPVQIGGNASIGYGFSVIKKVDDFRGGKSFGE